MDTDCLQEEISVTPERTPAVRSRQVHPGIHNRDAAEPQRTTSHWNGMKGSKSEGGSASPTSRIEAAKRSLEKAMNGDSGGGSAKGDDEELTAASAVKVMKDSGFTSSPSPNFKSSYAKSLADSYRRASIPVVVASPKGKFYFKNEEFLSLSMRTVKQIDNNHEKFHSLSMNGDSRVSLTQKSEPQSLPPIIDSYEQNKLQENGTITEESALASSDNHVIEKLQDKDMFVPFDQLENMKVGVSGCFTQEDLNNLSFISTSDGRKLVKLSDLKGLLKQQVGTQNGRLLDVSGCEKDSQLENLRVEHAQLGQRVDQLCHALADRDSTIQRLEEDLLRIRMECQRLMVDNRSLKSSVGQGATQTHPSGTDSSSQTSQLQQQVQLLTAQLNKAEQSRHTYEAATRQLVDFLHTVNSTLNTANHLYTNNSPTCSLHSSASTTTTKTSSSTPGEPEDDPPYRPGRPTTPPLESTVSQPASKSTKGNAEAMKKAGSVWVLPTHSLRPRKVSRAASTHCVASAVSNEPTGAGASPGSERTRPLATDFLATRARELLASLKSLIRSDSVLKLNVDPKKSASSSSNGKSKSSNKNSKVEITQIVPMTDTESFAKTATVLENPQNSEIEGSRRPTSLSLPGGDPGGGKADVLHETNTSLTKSQNLDETSVAATPGPRIGTGETREDILLPQSQSSIVNGNPQPLSLMVVGEHPCTPAGDNRYASLPMRTHLSRTLTDADQRLVWV